MIRRHFFPLFALVMVVPVALLSFFAVRTLDLENEAVSARRVRLLDERLKLAEAIVASRLQILGTELLAQAHRAYISGGETALRKLVEEKEFAQAFVFQSRILLSPQPKESDLTQSVILAHARTHISEADPSTGVLVAMGNGAYTLLRCEKDSDGLGVCIAINPDDVTNVLRSALGLVARTAGLSRVNLIAPDDHRIGLQEQLSKGAASARSLDGVLQGWRLEADEPPLDDDGMQRTGLLYLVAGSLIAAWIVMAWMLQRSALAEANMVARRAGIIAQLAHELRTPLANLQLHVDLLQRKPDDRGAVTRYATVLSSEIGRLAQLAENAIDVARGAVTGRRLEVAVPDECVRAVLTRYAPTLTDAKCEPQLVCNAGAPCRFDRPSWERCLINLVDNARKYAPGAPITITTQLDSGLLRLEVTDGGPGISGPDKEQIFEPFSRGTGKVASGFGLGLAAVRTLAQQNGGNCWVEDATSGARFVVTMNVMPLEAGEDAGKC